jgi:hypothetical protein
MGLIHTTKGDLEEDTLERKEVPHEHGVNTEYYLDGELVRRDCNVDLNLAKQVTP